jgi:hypothetical protein
MYNTNVSVLNQSFHYVSIQSKLESGNINEHAYSIFKQYCKKFEIPLQKTSIGLHLYDEFIKVEGTYCDQLNVRTGLTSIIVKMDKSNFGLQLYYYKDGRFEVLSQAQPVQSLIQSK